MISAFGVEHPGMEPISKSDYNKKYKKNPHKRRNVAGWTIGGAAAGLPLAPLGSIVGGVAGNHYANKYNKYADKRQVADKRKRAKVKASGKTAKKTVVGM